MQPIATIDPAACRRLKVLFSDIDDTLTLDRKIPLRVLENFARLRESGLSVCLVTGRPAGYGVTLTTYFDLFDCVITENGGILSVDGSAEALFAHIDREDNYPLIKEAVARIDREIVKVVEPVGNFMRKSDFAIDRKYVTDDELARMEKLCAELEVNVIASSIMVHLYRGQVSKGAAIIEVLKRRFAEVTPDQVMTMGDSPNDAAMFDSSYFPLSAGVANVAKFAETMEHKPRYIAQAYEADGAVEIMAEILSHRSG